MARSPNLRWLRGVDGDESGGLLKPLLFVIAAGAIVAASYFIWKNVQVEDEVVTLPDFASIKDIKERKKAFFDFLMPFVVEANEEIVEQRQEILKLKEIFEKKSKLSSRRTERVRDLAIEYGFEDVGSVTSQVFLDLLSRLDAVPPSIALSQAALESAWGTSRFAQEGNNLYGMRCYTPGCGIIPRERRAGETYEVAKYASPRDSFSAYLKNLNTNMAYVSMRGIRRALRRQEIPLTGYDLAEGLERYSEEGYDYVRKLQILISSNELGKYDEDQWKSLKQLN